MPTIWVGKRPQPRRPWTWWWELLHHRASVGSLCCCGGLGLIIMAVVVLGLKRENDFKGADCLVLEESADDGNCTVEVFVESCSQRRDITHSATGTILPCLGTLNFEIDANISCFAPKSCLPSDPVFITSSDPNYEETNCKILSQPSGDGNCSLKVHSYHCNETISINEEMAGIPLSCSTLNVSIDNNMTCYSDIHCISTVGFSSDPHPGDWDDPTQADIVLLLCSLGMMPCLAMAIKFCKQNLLRVTKFRELPY